MDTLASGEVFTVVVVVAAALCIGVGVIFPALGQARAVSQAIEAIARQPDEAPTITRNLFVGLAMIESQALYVLIIALILLFANPLSGFLAQAVAKGQLAVWFLAASAAAAALAVTIGTMFSALGQGRVTGSALESIAEQPAVKNQVSTTLFVSLAFLESLALYALIIALILLFANPVLKLVVSG